jgi:hypothetical protein
MSKKDLGCAYCPDEASTRDHVPCRKFFPEPRPSNLITVPSCARCNNSISNDEEYFLIRVLAIAGAATEESAAVLKQRFSTVLTPRRLQRIRELAGAVRMTPVTSPGGVYLGHAPMFSMDAHRMNHVLEKVVRGLYYHEFRRRVPEGLGVAADIEPARRLLRAPAVQAMLDAPSRRRGVTVFEYKIQAPVVDKPELAVFFMTFFGRVLAIGAVVTHATLKEWARRRPAPQ